MVATVKKRSEHYIVLDNGITLIVTENDTADLVACRIFLKNAGTRWESCEQAGLFHLIATTLTKGTETLTAAQIAESVESVGASLGADTTSDYFFLGFKTISVDFSLLLAMASEILRKPIFPAAEVELEKRQILQGIRSQQELPMNVAFNQLRQAMYPNHPYGVSVLGTQETVSSLTQADLVEYHQRFFRPDHLIVSLSGRITHAAAIAQVEKTFGDWSPPTHVHPKLDLAPLIPTTTLCAVAQETQQSIIMLGYLGTSVNHQDYPVLKLLSSYLGNGLSSRLFVELREKLGLAYDVSAFYPTRLDTANFITHMGTAPENTAIALDNLRSEIARLSETTLSPKELQGAKNKLLGQQALGKQSNSEIAQLNGWYEALGLAQSFESQFQSAIAQITSQQVQQVAQTYFQCPYVSLVGPEAAIAVI